MSSFLARVAWQTCFDFYLVSIFKWFCSAMKRNVLLPSSTSQDKYPCRSAFYQNIWLPLLLLCSQRFQLSAFWRRKLCDLSFLDSYIIVQTLMNNCVKFTQGARSIYRKKHVLEPESYDCYCVFTSKLSSWSED